MITHRASKSVAYTVSLGPKRRYMLKLTTSKGAGKSDSIRKFSNRPITFESNRIESDGRFEFESNLETSQVPIHSFIHSFIHSHVTTKPNPQGEDQHSFYIYWYRPKANTYIHRVYTVSQKKNVSLSEDNLNMNCPVTISFGTLITQSIGHWTVFHFVHIDDIAYSIQLSYLGKLLKPENQE